MIADIYAKPQAGLAKYGDCGACCIAGIVRKSVADVYQEVFGEIRDGLCYMDMTRAIEHYGLEYDTELPKDPRPRKAMWKQFGDPSWYNFISWFDNAYGKIHAGYVGLAQININERGCIEGFTDHWVIINGVTYKSEAAVDKIVHVSCPTYGVYDRHAKHFLQYYGGYNTIWVKRKS